MKMMILLVIHKCVPYFISDNNKEFTLINNHKYLIKKTKQKGTN